MSERVSLGVPQRHVDKGFAADWFAVRVSDETVIVNEAGEGSVTAYTVAGRTKNPRVIATADAVLWEGIVGLPHYEDGMVEISHRFAGVEDRIVIHDQLRESVPTLERTQLVRLDGVGGIVEFECSDCGEHVERERHQMDLPGLTPGRCTSCTFDRMGGDA